MDTKQIPLSINKNFDLYSDFGSRLGALLLDGLIMSPVWILIAIINSQSMNMQYYTLILNLLFVFWYMVYLPKTYGGTPGKLVAGLKIIKTDGSDIGWNEAFLRYSISLGFAIIMAPATIFSLMQADAETYNAMGWLQQNTYLQSFVPFYQWIFIWSSFAWLIAEIIVYFTDDRSRAIHDKIGGTVVVKKIYHENIKEFMTESETAKDEPETTKEEPEITG
jgi:uncharacterized RDD family membrane protein YckC